MFYAIYWGNLAIAGKRQGFIYNINKYNLEKKAKWAASDPQFAHACSRTLYIFFGPDETLNGSCEGLCPWTEITERYPITIMNPGKAVFFLEN